MADHTVVLIKELSSLGEKLSSGGGEDQSVRNEALLLSRKITASLEQPQNVAVDLAFSVCPISPYWHSAKTNFTPVFASTAHANRAQPFLAMAARVADGLDLFKHTASSKGPITSGELAALSGGEELLISMTACFDWDQKGLF